MESQSGGGSARGAGARRPFFRRRKSCPFSGPSAPKIDYKDVKLLQRFVSERGKIVPSRITAVSTRKQRELAQAIKRARFIGVLPYSVHYEGGGGRRRLARAGREAGPDGPSRESAAGLCPQLPAAAEEGVARHQGQPGLFRETA